MSSAAAVLRVAWTIGSIFVVESFVFGLSVLPGVVFLEWHFDWSPGAWWLRVLLLSMAFIPAYLIFALSLIVLSGLTTRVTGWRTPPDAQLAIKDLSWPLLDWARYMVSIQLVRIFAGSLFRSTPVWSFYMRLNGARMGRRVFVNSLAVTDHNLLVLEDDVVIGGDVHLSGHTVESGYVKTARVHLGRGVTVGVGSVVGIGVEAGEGCQIGALSFVPKYEKLDAGATYVGGPVHKVDRG